MFIAHSNILYFYLFIKAFPIVFRNFSIFDILNPSKLLLTNSSLNLFEEKYFIGLIDKHEKINIEN